MLAFKCAGLAHKVGYSPRGGDSGWSISGCPGLAQAMTHSRCQGAKAGARLVLLCWLWSLRCGTVCSSWTVRALGIQRGQFPSFPPQSLLKRRPGDSPTVEDTAQGSSYTCCRQEMDDEDSTLSTNMPERFELEQPREENSAIFAF